MIVYTRGSTSKQILTIGAQRDRAERYCKMTDTQITEVIDDKAVSSSKPLGERPGGRKLERLIAQGNVRGVIISRIDRAFRSTVECLATVERWQKQGVALHILEFGGTPLNTKSSTGKFILAIFAAVAEMERTVISERTTEALQHRKANGKLVTRPDRVRYGWACLGGKNVVRDEEEQQVIVQIISWHELGWGPGYIAERLMADEVKIRGKVKWHSNTVARILKRSAEDGA